MEFEIESQPKKPRRNPARIKAQTGLINNTIRSLAAESPRDVRMLLSSLYSDLMFAGEGMRSDLVLDATELVPEFRAAIGNMDDERFAVVFLDQGRRVLGSKVYDGGSRTRTVLYPRQLFRDAFEFDASGMVLAHNHPGGSCLPSGQDRELTRRVIQLGDSLEVTLIDHLIITKESHASFRQAGWM